MKFFWVCGLIPSSNKHSRYIYIVILVATVLLSGCSSHPMGPADKDILKPDKFVEVLIDMHYYEGIYSIAENMDYLPSKIKDIDTLDFYKPVLDKHGIDRNKFENSLKYYSYKPNQLEDMYDRVVDELSRRLREAEIKDRQVPENDGL